MPKFYLLATDGRCKTTYENAYAVVDGRFIHITAQDGGRTLAIVSLAPGERIERAADGQ